MEVLIFEPKEHFLSNMYIIYSGKEAAVVDPSQKFERAKDVLITYGLKIKYIIVSHAHFDHILSIDDWVENTGAEVICGFEDAEALSNSSLNCYYRFLRRDIGYYGEYTTVIDGDVLKLADENITVISTPGHTRGSITLKTDRSLFVGDVIFENGSYGRYDLPGGDAYTLALSISKLCDLDEALTVYSGHGPKTTIKEYKKYRRI